MPGEIIPKVATTTGIWTAAGIWTAIIAGLIGSFTAWIRYGPKWKELALNARANELDTLRQKVITLETKVDLATTTSHHNEMKLVYAINAFTLLAARVRSEWPNDPSLAQAMTLMAAATGNNIPGYPQALVDGLNSIRTQGDE